MGNHERRHKGRALKSNYKADFICFDSIVVELKAVSELTGVHEAQVINYLKATGLSCGLLINFGAPKLSIKKYLMTPSP